MEHPEIQDRLRRLGSAPVDERLAAEHLSAIATVAPRARWRRTIASVAAAALVIGVAVGVLAAQGDGPAVRLTPAAEQQQAPGPEAFSCTGPPPWAGRPSEADDPAAREAFRAWRVANCPADVEGLDDGAGRPDLAPTYGPDDYTCTGPPPWAGTPPTGEPGQRGADARARGEWRQANCPTDDPGEAEPGD